MDQDTQAFYQQAKAAGYKDSDIQAYLQSMQQPQDSQPSPIDTAKQSVFNTISTQPANDNNGSGNFLLDMLPTAGSIVGGLAGAELGPGALATAGLGGAAGEFLKEKLEGKKANLGDIATQGVLGAAGEGVGGLVGKVAGKFLPKIGQTVSDYGSGLITKGLNLTPKMEADVAKQMGEKSVQDFLAKRGLQGVDHEGLQSYIEPIQQQFDSIANNPNIKVDPNAVVSKFDDAIKQLQDSILPADKSRAQVLEQIRNNFISRFDTGEPVGADVLTAMRRTVDKGVKDFGADPAVASTGNLTRRILQDSIEESDNSGTLGPTGDELHKLYTLLSKSEPRQFVGTAKSAMPIGGKDAIAAFLGNIFGGPVGAGAALGLEKAATSKAGTKFLAGAAQKAGAAISSAAANKTVGNVAQRIVGQTAAGTVGSVLPRSDQNGNNEPNNNTPQNTQSPSSIAQGASDQDANGNFVLPTQANSTVPQLYTTENYLKDLQRFGNNPIMLEKARAAYQASQDQANQYIETHQLDSDAKNFVQTSAPQINEQMNELRQLIKQEGTGPLNDAGPVQFVRAQTDPKYARMMALMTQLSGIATKANVGGRLSNFDIQKLNSMPSAGDSTQSALAKLDQAQQILVNQYKRLLPLYQLSTYQPQQQTTGNSFMPPIPGQ